MQQVLSLRVRRAACRLAIAVLATSSSAATWAEVWPVRLDPVEPASTPTIPDNPQQIDAYLQVFEATDHGTSEEPVPLGEIVTRCGDGDGCLMRLLLTTGSTRAKEQAGWWFSISSNGFSWRSTGFDGTTKIGVINDEDEDTVFEIGAIDKCRLRDEEVPPNLGTYVLEAYDSDPVPSIECLLRIDD